MKVIAINGSPKENGNTARSLAIFAEELKKEGIETEILNIGKEPVRGCVACTACFKNKNEKCVFDDDITNEFIAKMKEADGIVLASATHYSGITGAMKSFLDRAFYVHAANGSIFRHKVAASLAIVRRSGGITAVDQLNKYLFYSEMLIASSNYWNVIQGAAPGEVEQDPEGMQIISVLAKNMAWLLKLVENGKGVVKEPLMEKKKYFNYIR